MKPYAVEARLLYKQNVVQKLFVAFGSHSASREIPLVKHHSEIITRQIVDLYSVVFGSVIYKRGIRPRFVNRFAVHFKRELQIEKLFGATYAPRLHNQNFVKKRKVDGGTPVIGKNFGFCARYFFTLITRLYLQRSAFYEFVKVKFEICAAVFIFAGRNNVFKVNVGGFFQPHGFPYARSRGVKTGNVFFYVALFSARHNRRELVLALYDQKVFAAFQIISNIEGKTRISARMAAYKHAVKPHFGKVIGTVEIYYKAFAARKRIIEPARIPHIRVVGFVFHTARFRLIGKRHVYFHRLFNARKIVIIFTLFAGVFIVEQKIPFAV